MREPFLELCRLRPAFVDESHLDRDARLVSRVSAMIIEVKVPSVGESVTSGVISAWHKKSGEFVNEGEPLFALETDKVSTDIVAEKSGVLDTRVPEGQEVKIGEVVAVIDDSKRAEPERKRNRQKKEPPKKKKRPEQKKKAAVAAGDDRGTSAAAAEPAQPESAPPATTLSPAVRRILEEKKLEPEKIRGTGEGGRLTKGDVLAAAEQRDKAGSVGEADSFPGKATPSPATAQL